MKITLELPDNMLGLHIVAITQREWPNVDMVNISVPTTKLHEGAIISAIDQTY